MLRVVGMGVFIFLASKSSPLRFSFSTHPSRQLNGTLPYLTPSCVTWLTWPAGGCILLNFGNYNFQKLFFPKENYKIFNHVRWILFQKNYLK